MKTTAKGRLLGITCTHCGGSGIYNYSELEVGRCKFCDGVGYKEIEKDMAIHGADLLNKTIEEAEAKQFDSVNKPKHYTSHPSGVEAITLTAHHDFCIGSAIKYLWRAGLKGESGEANDTATRKKHIEDLKKAVWYINHKIKMLENET